MLQTPPMGASAAGAVRRPLTELGCAWRYGVEAAWLTVTGELDLATAAQLDDELRSHGSEPPLLVLDLRGLSFLDLAGLRVILAADERQASRGGRLVILRGSPAVDRVFELTGTDHVVETVALRAERGWLAVVA